MWTKSNNITWRRWGRDADRCPPPHHDVKNFCLNYLIGQLGSFPPPLYPRQVLSMIILRFQKQIYHRLTTGRALVPISEVWRMCGSVVGWLRYGDHYTRYWNKKKTIPVPNYRYILTNLSNWKNYIYMSHFSYACKMRCPLNLVLQNCEYLWFYLTFWIAILDCGLKLHKPSIHTLVMLEKGLEIH